ncbi:Propanediol utilization protein [Desulfotomaculum nigrificans CO-1-SRB]|uniref:Phosphate propanoyltransferase n=1 Tax=Desulfotomaculum nigrificans (strain DSM 14880 / VKM B-2319 / CO-1-SRB) TaxID=868595 RepID=F6B324_DESCC|nr:phosphate propanoyltransferase [Desulfotomaculum nigrificans]AEF93928.1 Propanediol utilization protein [Desulfotomaculum nigrificans CO-1-SRB]
MGNETLTTRVNPDEITAIPVPVGISARHIHLSQEHVDILFGPGYELKKYKDLSQPGQYACEETLTVVGPKGVIEKVRVLGPLRKQSQVELSISDCFKLGIRAPLRDSGDLAGSASVTLVGPVGSITLKEGAIIAARHIHMHTSDAEKYGLEDGDRIYVRAKGPRGIIFGDVLVRVSDKFKLEMHVDTDEGNAVGLRNGDTVFAYKIHGHISELVK